MEFNYDGGGLGKGGDVTLYFDGKQVGEGRVERRWRWSSRPTTPAMSARTPARRSRRITARAATRSPARQGGADRHRRRRAESTDHLVSPEEAVRSRWRGSSRKNAATDAAAVSNTRSRPDRAGLSQWYPRLIMLHLDAYPPGLERTITLWTCAPPGR